MGSEALQIMGSTAVDEAVPTEDTIQALIEALVGPCLPRRASSSVSPSPKQEEKVAKQMHAVVLLYNYYHRKQFPHLELLDFESFCKLAIITKPNLLSHMKFMQGCNGESTDPSKQFSITEKKVMEACNICKELDMVKDTRSIEKWPIFKVAVIVIDSMKKNCLLLYSSVTEGVWSLIEDHLAQPCYHLETVSDLNTQKKRTLKWVFRDESYPALAVKDENEFQNIAYSAVKKTTGIDQTDLVLLEKHFVYSLSQAKAATRFYLMQYTKEINEEITQVPIKDAINSLRGPLVKKSLGYEVTPVIEYFHLLPYGAILSSWFSRETSNSLQPLSEGSENENMIFSPNPLKCNSANDGSSSAGPSADALNNKIASTDKEKNDTFCTSGSPRTVFRPDSMPDDSSLHYPLKISVNEEEVKISPNIIQDEQLERRNDALIVQSKPDAFESGIKDEVTVSAMEIKPCTTESLNIEHSGRTDICLAGPLIQYATRVDNLSLAQGPLESRDKVHSMMISKRDDLFQAALRALLKKRDELTLQQRQLEDDMARCERDIKTVINGGEDALMLKLESIIEACNAACSKGGNQNFSLGYRAQCPPCNIKRRKLSEAILRLKNPCQEMDDICSENNWMLPRYSVFPSNGWFQANINVKGDDFEYTFGGDLRSNPREARESAAAHMLSKLRSIASQSQEN